MRLWSKRYHYFKFFKSVHNETAVYRTYEDNLEIRFQAAGPAKEKASESRIQREDKHMNKESIGYVL